MQVVPIHVLSRNVLMRWRPGGLVRLGFEVVGLESLQWWALVAGGRGLHLPRMPSGRLCLKRGWGEAKAPQAQREVCNGKSRCEERSGVKQSGEPVCHCSVVVLSILGGSKGRKHPQ